MKLPRDAAKLITLALKDLTTVRRMKNTYAIDMGVWHEYDEEIGKCTVCFAGAVIAQTLKVSAKRLAYPGHFSECTRKALIFLDELRADHISGQPDSVGYAEDNWKEFRGWLRKCITHFKLHQYDVQKGKYIND